MTSNEGDRWRKLEVWQLADDFALAVYQASKDFPANERYGITSQLRRAALSIPTNIVEGYSRRGDRELSRFLDIALGSHAEAKYLIHFSRKLGYLNANDYASLTAAAEDLGSKLWRFSETVRTSAQNG